MAGQTRINGNLIDTGTDPEDIVSISTGDARYPKLPDGTPLDANQVAQGFIQREGTRGDLDPTLAVAIELNLLGYPVAGGYYAGLIDTTGDGSIQSNDDYQTGQRYALIVSDKSLEGGRGSSPASGLPTGDLRWDALDRTGEAGCFTRWNGLEATNVIIAKNDTSYEVHDFIEAVRSQYPAATTPGGSEWYLPAMDELELLYRNFKPTNADNDTRDFPQDFPGSNPSGKNLSSVPEGFNYENSPRIPDVTFLDLFKEGNAQSLDQLFYWSTTDADEGGLAWTQNFIRSGPEGVQRARPKDATFTSVRPVRRVVLDDSNDSKNRSGNYNINGSITAHGLNTDGGDVSFTEDTGTTPKFVWDASAERLQVIGSTELRRDNSDTNLTSAFGQNDTLKLYNETDVTGNYTSIGFTGNSDQITARIASVAEASDGRGNLELYYGRLSSSVTTKGFELSSNGDISFYEDTGTTPKFFWDASAERLIVQGAAFDNTVTGGDGGVLSLRGGGNADLYKAGISFGHASRDSAASISAVETGSNDDHIGLAFFVHKSNVQTSGSIEAARIDSDGNVLVGKTSPGIASPGHSFRPAGVLEVRRDIATAGLSSVGYISRGASDGNILTFYRDTSAVGSIGAIGDNVVLADGDTGLKFDGDFDAIVPASFLANRDNAIDLGASSVRFDDVFATNGTIQTSDVNEKQDIEELSDAEARVAAKAKTLLRKYRWKSAVEEKGEEARIHFGIIAQDLEQAFIDEGLDAGRYGMFIRGEWYEAEVEKTCTVENDDGTETTETYITTETYETAEEAPEGAVHKERLGVRYHELLAFIIAAI